MTAPKGNKFALRAGQTAPSTKRHIILVTQEEHDEHTALADYIGVSLAALFRQLMREKREQLQAEGKRPPKKPRAG
jgi:hypothetical protein